MKSYTFEAIVVGSGFGGAVTALRLAKAGVETCVLERGVQWERPGVSRPFPRVAGSDKRHAWRSNKHPLRPNAWRSRSEIYPGLLERIRGEGITAVCGAAWGGGSVVYGGMFVRPPARDFDKIFGTPALSGKALARYFDRVKRIIKPEYPTAAHRERLERNYYKSAVVFREQARRAGLASRRERVLTTVDWGVICDELDGGLPPSAIIGEAIMGFNSGAMKSLDKNYLRLASTARTPIVRRPQTIVDAVEIETSGQHAGWYRLRCRQITREGHPASVPTVTYHARRLFICAGSMNTTKLFLHAKARGALPKLNRHVGEHWGGNGDYLLMRTRVGEDVNMKITDAMKFRQGSPTMTALYFPDDKNPVRVLHTPGMDILDRRLWMLGMSIPTKLGRLRLKRKGNQLVPTWPTDGDRRGRDRIDAETRPLKRKNPGGMKRPLGTKRVTFHPLGGMVLGRACDLVGRVKGYERLYVIDSSLFPGHTAACNPAWSVAAMAERCIEKIIEEDIEGH